MRRMLIGLLVVGCLFAGERSASADLSYQFANTSGTAQSVFTISGIGGTVDVRVYLAETNGGTTLSSENLFSGGVQVNFNNPSGIASVASAGHVSANPAFDDTPPVYLAVNSTSAGFVANTLSPSGLAPASDKVYLGTFTFTGAALGSTTIATVVPNAGFDVNVTGASTVLDSLIANSSATINVVAVPEPTSMLLTGFAVSAMAGGMWWKRRKTQGGDQQPPLAAA